jgi:hypothetical protein
MPSPGFKQGQLRPNSKVTESILVINDGRGCYCYYGYHGYCGYYYYVYCGIIMAIIVFFGYFGCYGYSG